ncbi:MAG: FAD-binding protein [Marinibacterium sp.]
MDPKNEADLAGIVADATGPLVIRGGGTRPIGNPVTGTALSVAGLSGVELYEPGALTLVAKAGTPVAEIDAVLAAEGQRLAFEPMDHRALLGTTGEPTLGGVVAGNVSGPRRIAVGACRDFVLGVRFVDGRGQVIKNGGRVMKNVTGYDLVRLMAGSRGTLGILSEVSLKVLPRPETVASVEIEGLDDAQGVAALSRALGSPFEVTGAMHLPAGDGARTMIRVEGFADQVAYRAGRLMELLADIGPVRVVSDAGEVAADWAAIRDVTAFADRPGDVWRVSVRPSQGPELAGRIRGQWAGAEVLFDWGGGLLWVRLPEGSDLRSLEIPGHATLVRAAPETRARLGAIPPDPPALASISAGLRAKFDPRGILNPGLMGPG